MDDKINIKMRIKYLTIVLSFVCAISIQAQTLNVKSLVVKTNDITARTLPRKDINGIECALLKVQIVGQGVTFSGNVMGDVEYKGNEYWVYMPNGSKRLKITHPDCLPMEVVFANYGIIMIRCISSIDQNSCQITSRK